MRHDLALEQFKRAERLGKRHRPEKRIRQQIIDAELARLALEFSTHRLRRTGHDAAMLNHFLVASSVRNFQPRGQAGVVLLDPQPVEVDEVRLHRRLEDAMCRGVGLGDKDVALHANDDAAREFRLQLRKVFLDFLNTVSGISVTITSQGT